MDGKVALVTGGSRGLGRAMSQAFADAGANVVVASRKRDACVALAEELTERTGNDALGTSCHVGRWEDCDRLVDEVMERYGRIDVLVNNAGLSPQYPSLPEVTEELFDKVIAVNLRGAFRLSSLAGPIMAERGGGSIINISSIAAIQPDPMSLPYAAAKAGLHAITLGMVRAFGPSVRVNAIVPGLFLTDISEAWDPDEHQRTVEDELPLRRAGQPQEIVGAAMYFATQDSSYSTGALLKVDGGLARG
ncbi:glucose 1-dehydrogenase [Nitriliruptoraceae bacterium ZYF776]|nr:glucose 1-dehydrogenase [Profundirhabdus halotolerans]